nr:hypothetical protein [uncultured Blautia sp.]
MKICYLKFNGKHPAESKDNRHPLDKPPEIGDYGAAYSQEYKEDITIIIDDIQEDDKDVEGVIYHHIGRGDT